MSNVHFACGEFTPGQRKIPDVRIKKPVPPIWIPLPPAPIPIDPGNIPPAPIDYWVCICKYPSPQTGPCTQRDRECIPKISAPPGVPTSVSFVTKAACESTGFGEAPCHIETYRCVETLLSCPPNSIRPSYKRRTCISCGLMRVPTVDCRYEKLADCAANCISERCEQQSPPGNIPPVGLPPGVIPPGSIPSRGLEPTTPTTYYGCINVSSTLCSDGRTIKINHKTCKYSTRLGAPYIYRNINDCRQVCSDEVFPCPDDLRSIPTGSAPVDRQIGVINDQILTRGLDLNRTNRRVNIFNLDDFTPPQESVNASTSSMYHAKYTFFNYSQVLDNTFVDNYLYLDIFATYIPQAVAYLINYKNSSISWNEKYITGLTKDKVVKSLNGGLLRAFESIKYIDGQKVSLDYFIGVIMRHLLYGTLEQFDATYYINLANKQKEDPELIIRGESDYTNRKKSVLGYLTKAVKPVDSSRYFGNDEKIEAVRQKFLLSDLETELEVETIFAETVPVALEDPGVPILDGSGLEDFVPQGPGDGYYLVLEGTGGDTSAIVLDTAVSAAYFQSPDVRKIALNSLGESDKIRLSVSSSFIDSELSSGFSLSRSVSALYFKLDLTQIEDSQKGDSFVDKIFASYTLVTDPEEIEEHSRDFGGKSSIVNINYDDPFFTYASNSSSIEWRQSDITFRSFTPSRSSDFYSILTRNIPDVIVLYPVSGSQHNPLYGESSLESITDNSVVRSLAIIPHFGLSKDELNRAGLKEKLLYEEEGIYQLGLVGIVDTQNVYYPFDSSQFPNSFEVSGRPVIGKFYNDILVNTLEQKYSFEYLTWWDVYRRMSLNEFAKFLYTAPKSLLEQLAVGWRGFTIKDILQREGITENLTEINSSVEDSIYVLDTLRNA